MTSLAILVLMASANLEQSREQRVEALLSKMTLGEKIELLAGVDDFYTRPVDRLGIPRFKMSDGPVGVRNYGPAVAFPAGVCLAATWNAALASQTGVALGQESRVRGVHFLLGPGVNIARVPQNGRNFEYFGEDPFLAAAMSVKYIKGLQSQGVAGTVKHYVANNQEIERGTIDVVVDERTLREIYLPAFEDSVVKGGVWAVMSSYNRINGPYSTAHAWLNNTVLKGEWGFKGIVMSDWGATHADKDALLGGLDLEMPGPAHLKPDRVKALVDSGEVPASVIDDKVRRLLRVAVALGWLDRPQEKKQTSAELASARNVALNVAREGVVLLRNKNALLPLDSKKVKSVVVVGPNAEPGATGGGGSSYTNPERSTSVFQGLRRILGESKVTLAAWGGSPAAVYERSLPFSNAEVVYFRGTALQGESIATRTLGKIDLGAGWGSPGQGVPEEEFSARITATIRPPKTGKYVFALESDDGVRIKVDGKLVLDDWRDHGAEWKSFGVDLKQGRDVPVEIEYYENKGESVLRFGWVLQSNEPFGAETKQLRNADAVVVCLGFNSKLEGEGWDRTYALPIGQAELIANVAKLNKNVVVVLNSGAGVDTTTWLRVTQALLQAWYPGQEGGTAIAEILTGKTNPSGKLPTSWEAKLADLPSMANYPGANGKVRYEEKLNIGYRFFDKSDKNPLFPFGFGLSYTTFKYSEHMNITRVGDKTVVAFRVRNTGKRRGMEIAQVYVSPPLAFPVDRPNRELKGFAKVDLRPGEEKRVEVVLDRRAFSYWDDKAKKWAVHPTSYGIWVGSSSDLLHLRGAVQVR